MSGPKWLSFHLPFDGSLFSEAADRVLLDDLAPRWSAWRSGPARRVFFIRYNEGGDHIRLRILPIDDTAAEVLIREVRALAQSSERIRELEEVPYEPEVERYGGPSGMPASEELFDVSSRAALSLLRKIDPKERSTRLGKGLLAQLVLIHGMLGSREAAARFAWTFGAAYLHRRAGDPARQKQWMDDFQTGFDRQSDRLAPYVEAAWAGLDEDEPLTPELDDFRRNLRPIFAELRALALDRKLHGESQGIAADAPWLDHAMGLLPSYVHMMNNRLGVDLREECYLAVLIHETLRAQDP